MAARGDGDDESLTWLETVGIKEKGEKFCFVMIPSAKVEGRMEREADSKISKRRTCNKGVNGDARYRSE